MKSPMRFVGKVTCVGFAFASVFCLCVATTSNSATESGAAEMPRGLLQRMDELEKELRDVRAQVAPAGTIEAFAGPEVPEGWLHCDGAALDKDIDLYKPLFKAIGQSWGDGTNKGSAQVRPVEGADFNLPDLRGYFLRGVNGTASRDPDKEHRTSIARGGNEKNKVGSVQGDDLRHHNHTGNRIG